jgi:ABC-type Fe3+-hydroxamate transport system substrate-binding protein
MNHVDLLNGVAVFSALSLAVWGGLSQTSTLRDSFRPAVLTQSSAATEKQPDGTLALRDASGALISLRPFSRIASTTMLSDRVLVDLCEPTRIVAFSKNGVKNGYAPYRFAGKPTIDTHAGVEALLALRPDLVLVNELVDPTYLARVREQGIAVFDLGHMRGLSTLLPSIRALGVLLGEPERAEFYAQNLAARMRRIAQAIPPEKRPKALYLATYADRLYGGADHTSYHDVLTAAGLRDVAAEAFLTGWPTLSSERVLALDPQVIVTKTGMAARICRQAGLENSAPCRGVGRIVELPGVLLDDPGPAMLEASEALYRTVWGSD